GPFILNSNLVLDSGADYLHLDEKEGHFVLNITLGHAVLESFQKQLGQDPFFDMQRMVSRPDQWLKPMAVNGMKVSLSIKPGTIVAYVAPWSNRISMALATTVEPGFRRQKFVKDKMPNVHWLKTQFQSLDTEASDGLGTDIVRAKMIMAGSAIMSSEAPRSVTNLL
uniref:ribulose-phosphate 3-epimerase n=1 Tax=Propithecus coquereli TaxID=379532 RepID=A0A2K6G6X3_PROCO